MTGRTLIFGLLFAAAARGWSLARWSPVVHGPAPELVRELCRANDFRPDAMLASPIAIEMGLHSVEPFVFDPTAAVLLCPGVDARPGIADVDDDADGVVDNASELGAMYSDDVCLAPSDDGYEQALQSEPCKVISRGAYVAQEANESLDERPSRLGLSGECDGRRWERLVVSSPWVKQR